MTVGGRVLGQLAVAALVISVLGVSDARAATSTFTGSCEFAHLNIRLNQGLSAGPQKDFDGTMAGPGKCSGAINGRSIVDRVSALDLRMSGHGSCSGAAVFYGQGTFTADGESLPVTATLTKPDATIRLIFELRGTDSGLAAGKGGGDAEGAIAPQELFEGGLGCANPKGNGATSVDIPFDTHTPLVSTVPGAPVAPPARVGLLVNDQRAGTVSRSGVVRTRCIAPVAGLCSVRIVRGGLTLARGSATGVAGQPVAIRARLTPAGRRALRRHRPVRATVRASVPGAVPRSRTIVVR